MLHRRNNSYFEEKLVQNSENLRELWKTLQSVDLNVKEGNKAKFSLNKDGTIQFEPRQNANTCDALRDLVPLVQFKKCEKHSWRSVNFTKVACNFTKINTPPWVFFTFLKLYKWYQIAQRTTFSKSSSPNSLPTW